MRAVLEVKKVSKSYRNKVVLDDLNFKVIRGEIFALLGINGAGKTTTIKMLTGLTQPTNGQIKYFNRAFDDNKLHLLPQIGCVMERPGFYDNLTVYENLELIVNIVGMHKPGYLEELLNLVKLLEMKDVPVKKLMVSDRQKLAIVKALLNNPSILILDEPLNGLDTVAINEIRTLLMRLSKEKHTTIFISSHVLPEIEKIADKIAVIHHGRIVEVFDHKKLQQNQIKQIVVHYESESDMEQLLKRKGYKFKMIDKNKVVITSDHHIHQVVTLLVEEQVEIKEIYMKEYDLEGYFVDLIQSQGH